METRSYGIKTRVATKEQTRMQDQNIGGGLKRFRSTQVLSGSVLFEKGLTEVKSLLIILLACLGGPSGQLDGWTESAQGRSTD